MESRIVKISVGDSDQFIPIRCQISQLSADPANKRFWNAPGRVARTNAGRNFGAPPAI